MLNLLIKLVSDTYTNVQAHEKSAEAKMKIQMLTEIGLFKRFLNFDKSRKQSEDDEEAAPEEKVYFVHRFFESSRSNSDNDDLGASLWED